MSSASAGRRRPAAAPAGWAALFAAAVTVAVVALPFVGFAYRAPALHVVLETANALIALLVGYLVYGRYRQSRRLQELLLVLALATVAIANLLLTALPTAVTIGSDEEFSRWAAVGIRFLGTVLLTTAALSPPGARLDRRRAHMVILTLGGIAIGVAALGLIWGVHLPPTVDPSAQLGDATRPQLAAHPLVLVAHALGVLLYSVSAVAFTRRSLQRGDELLRWVGAGCVLAAAARVHYLLFPSLYSEYVYTGDLLRLGFYVMILLGAAREIRSYWEARARAAVLEDRRRMARDLHDGLAQELAYITAQCQRLALDSDVETVHQITAAARRAGSEARRAISALTRPVGEPFPAALERLADELAHRHDVKVVTDLDRTAEVDAVEDEALLRIVSEAVHNAVRHGRASRVDVRLTGEPLGVVVTDDGCGFDTTTGPTGGFGLTSMRERAEGVGARFEVTSEPGGGTTVRVRWP